MALMRDAGLQFPGSALRGNRGSGTLPRQPALTGLVVAMRVYLRSCQIADCIRCIQWEHKVSITMSYCSC